VNAQDRSKSLMAIPQQSLVQRGRIAGVETVRLTVRVQPNARKNEVTGLKEGLWQVKVTAPPVGGKANEELLRFLSDALEISKSTITIDRGMTSRVKTLSIRGLTGEQVKMRLERHIKQE